jgi:HEAT repeat protein
MLIVTLTLLVAQAATSNAAVEFLESLLKDPKKQPSFEEGMQVADTMRAASPASIDTGLPAIVESLRTERDAVKLWAASFLHAISLRPDSDKLLRPYVSDILSLLQSPDERLQRTAPAVLPRIPSEYSRVRPVFSAFLSDDNRKPEVQAAVGCALTQMGPLTPESRKAFAAFLTRRMSSREKIAALESVACQPADDLEVAALVARSLNDDDADVRARAVYLIGRLGPKSIDASRGLLVQVANRDTERADIRALAARIASGR